MTRRDVTQPDDRGDRGDRGSGDDRLGAQVTESFTRIAQTMPVDGGGVALAAVREARAIRRRRSMGTVAAAAALVAVAVPLSTRLAAPTRPGVPAVQPPAAASGSTTTGPRPAAGADFTVTLPTTASPSGRVVRPYVVDGTYHGASGSVRLAATEGLAGVLNLDGAKVLQLRPGSGEPKVVVQTSDGSTGLTLRGVDGRAVADATGQRWVLLDPRTGTVTVRDPRGAVLDSTTSAPLAGQARIRSVVGFSGGRVVLTTAAGTSAWDLGSGQVDEVSGDTALDASDTAARAVYETAGVAGSSCWQVRSTTDQAPVAAPTCGAAGIVSLSADGRYVVVRQTLGDTVLVYRATGGRPVLQVSVPAGVTVDDTSLRIGLDELVLATSDRTGHRLVGCTTRGMCEVLTATSHTPYLLVRD